MVYKVWHLTFWDESINEQNAYCRRGPRRFVEHVFSDEMANYLVKLHPKVSISSVSGLDRPTILKYVYSDEDVIDDLVSNHPIFAKDKFRIYNSVGEIVDYYPIKKVRTDKIKSIGI